MFGRPLEQPTVSLIGIFRPMFLTNRFFLLLGGVIILFTLAFPFVYLLPFAKVSALLLLAITLTDTALLFVRPLKIDARRETSDIYSLGDPNPVNIHLDNKGILTLHCTVTDAVPVQFQRRDVVEYCTLKPNQTTTIQYELTPFQRGIYEFGPIDIFASTRLRLVERHLELGAAQTVDVYPSIIQMKKYALRAMRHIAHDTGIKKLRRIGHSYEFEQIKNYVEGDDYRSINWKASSRKGSLMVNQYEDERSQQIYCIIDKSRVMRMPFEGLSLMDYSINAVLAISNIILQKQDKAGLLSFSDVVGTTLKAERDNSQLRRIMEALYREKERSVESNYELLNATVQRLVGARSLLLLFTNFESNYALERALPAMRRLNMSHLLVVVFFENTEIKQLSQKPAENTMQIYRQVLASQFVQEKREMVIRLRQYGIQAILTKPQDLTINTINKYLELKSRGLI